MHEKKIKGDIGFAFAIAVATEQGWSCCIPFSEHCSYDFIAEKNGKCKRVQVKYTTPSAEGVLKVKLASSWADKHGVHTKKRKFSDFFSR